jgi:hypothetical protein
MEKLPIFKVVRQDAETGIGLVSFVSAPAIEKGWMALKNQTPAKLHLSEDGEKMVVTGPVLIPGKLIFRLQRIPGTKEEGPFYIFFEAPEIEAFASKFLKDGFTTKTNLEHEIALDSNHVAESWIVTDPEMDKSKALGFKDVVAGTWFMSYKVNDSELWKNEIKTGKRTGFSIEGFFDFEQVELSTINLNNMSFWKTIAQSLSARKQKVKLGEASLADGRKIVWDDSTMLVYLVNEDGTQGDALPDGDYSLSDTGTIKVVAGKIETVTPPAAPAANEVSMHSIVLTDGKVISIDPTSLDAFLLDIGDTITKKPLQDGEYYSMNYCKIIVAGGKFSRQYSNYPFIADVPAETVTEPTAQLTQTLYSVWEKAEEFREASEKAVLELKAATEENAKLKAQLAATPGGKPIVTTPTEEVAVVHESRSQQALSEVQEMAVRLREKAKAKIAKTSQK